MIDNTLNFKKKEQNNPRPPRQAPDLEGMTDAVCAICENPFFQQKVVIKKRSALLSPTGQEEIHPAMILACEQCGWVFGAPVDENLKKEVQRLKNEQKAVDMLLSLGRKKKEEAEKNQDTVDVAPPETITAE